LTATNPNRALRRSSKWKGVMQYVRSFPDTNGNGIPDIPEKYKGQLGRIVEAPSFNPVNLVSRPATTTIVVVAVLSFVVLLIVALGIVIRKRRKAQKGQGSK